MKTALARLGVALCGMALLALTACDDEPSDPPADHSAPADGRPVDATGDAAVDAAADAMADADAPDATPDGSADATPDADPIDAEPDHDPPDHDPPDQTHCPEATAHLDAAAAPLDPDGAWHLDLARPSPHFHDADCGDTAGAELTVAFTPAADGRHLIVARGDFTALYAAPPCDPTARLGACAAPGDDVRLLSIELRAGQPVTLVLDTAFRQSPAAARLALYPPRERGESCALLDDAPIAPPCAPGLVCDDARCTPATPPAIETVRAISDGQTLRLAVTADDAAGDLLEALWARVDPADRFRQLEVITIDREDRALDLRGFIEAPDLAAAAEVEVELLDAALGSTRTRVAVEAAPIRALAEACDPLGVDDVCAPGTACAAGLCRALALEAWAAPGDPPADAPLRAHLADPPAATDDLTLRYRLLDDAGAPLGEWIRLPRLDANPADPRLSFGGIVPAPATATTATTRLVPAARPPSLPITAPLQRLPLRPDGAACDPTGITDACIAPNACINGSAGPHCQRAEPPAIEALRPTRGERAIGLKLTWFDPNDDVLTYRLQVIDAAGNIRWAIPASPLPPVVGRSAQFSLLAPEMPQPGDRARVVVLDSTGLPSPAVDAAFLPATPLREGALCDLLGGLDHCPQNTLCAPPLADLLAPPTCRRPEVECPEDWAPTPWEVDAGLPFSWNDTSRNGPDRDAGLCDTVSHRPELVFRVVAPRTERWMIEVDTLDTTLYVRRYCALPVPFESEIACGARRTEFDVIAGTPYFIFVDGPGPNGGRFRIDLDRIADVLPLPLP